MRYWHFVAVSAVLSAAFLPLSLSAKDINRNDWHAANPVTKRAIPIKVVTQGLHRVRAENKMLPREKVKYLTVHHTDIPLREEPFATRMKQHQSSMQGGYSFTVGKVETKVTAGDVPYHFVISEAGEIAVGREAEYAAYSNTNYLTPIANHLTIALAGDFNKVAPPEGQVASLVRLLAELAKEHGIAVDNISYHAAVVKEGDSDCPGTNLIKRFDAIKSAVGKKLGQ
ncbi:MAG: peptidoglycan recognition protein family protein [Alphaproteobacteria bacterium]|nr:peptidoglycan recognition protein family protein [Alphaproteobacteria bacterium]